MYHLGLSRLIDELMLLFVLHSLQRMEGTDLIVCGSLSKDLAIVA